MCTLCVLHLYVVRARSHALVSGEYQFCHLTRLLCEHADAVTQHETPAVLALGVLECEDVLIVIVPHFHHLAALHLCQRYASRWIYLKLKARSTARHRYGYGDGGACLRRGCWFGVSLFRFYDRVKWCEQMFVSILCLRRCAL